MPPITTPTRIEKTSRSLRLQRALADHGWKVNVAESGPQCRASVALVCRRRTSLSVRESALFHVFGDDQRVKTGDLWTLLGEARRLEAESPVLCLSPRTRMGSRAAEIAARLGVQVVRLED